MTAEILKFQPREETRSKADSVFSPIIAQETIYAQEATRKSRRYVRFLRNATVWGAFWMAFFATIGVLTDV